MRGSSQSTRKPRRSITARLILIVIVAAVSVWWFARPAPSEYRVSPDADVLQAREKQQEAWSKAEFLPLISSQAAQAPAALIESRFSESIEDPERLAGADLRDALSHTLANQVLARSTRSADAYLALAQRGCSRWVEPRDTREWAVVKLFAEEGLKKSFVPGKQQETLEAVVRYCQGGQRGNLRAMGVGKKGASILIFTVRSEVELMARMMPTNETEATYWYGSTHGGFMLRMPRRSFREVLASDGSVKCANVLLIAETSEGHRYTWHSTWFLDAQNACWSCH